MVSCKQPSQGSKQLIIAEKELKKDYARGGKMISQIPESVFQEEDFYSYHNKKCIANIYFYKTQYYIASGQFNEAQKSFLYFIKYHNDDETEINNYNEYKIINNEQLFLNTLATQETSDKRYIQKLNKQLSWFKPKENLHNRIAESYTTEYRIFKYKLYFYSIIFVFLCILLMQILKKRDYKYANILNKYKHKEKQLNNQINQLTFQTTNNTIEIGQLTQQLNQLQYVNSMHLGRGKEILDAVKAGGNMKNISIDDEQCFIDYYAFCNPTKFHKLINHYVSITLRHTTFLILSEMGYSDKEICDILFIKNSTIRNYRMRINKKQISG